MLYLDKLASTLEAQGQLLPQGVAPLFVDDKAMHMDQATWGDAMELFGRQPLAYLSKMHLRVAA